VDIDGTIADVNHRLHYIRGNGRKEWKRFFAAMEQDPPVLSILQKIKKIAESYEIVIITGRPDEYRRQTESWLRKYNVPFTRLLMRASGDHRPDYVIKREMLDEAGRDRVALVIDDRPLVCQMFRDAGIRVFQVTSDEGNQQVNEIYQQLSGAGKPIRRPRAA